MKKINKKRLVSPLMSSLLKIALYVILLAVSLLAVIKFDELYWNASAQETINIGF